MCIENSSMIWWNIFLIQFKNINLGGRRREAGAKRDDIQTSIRVKWLFISVWYGSSGALRARKIGIMKLIIAVNFWC